MTAAYAKPSPPRCLEGPDRLHRSVGSIPYRQRALEYCERAYAADASYAGAKRRLAGWAPEKWKERIAKEVSGLRTGRRNSTVL